MNPLGQFLDKLKEPRPRHEEILVVEVQLRDDEVCTRTHLVHEVDKVCARVGRLGVFLGVTGNTNTELWVLLVNATAIILRVYLRSRKKW